MEKSPNQIRKESNQAKLITKFASVFGTVERVREFQQLLMPELNPETNERLAAIPDVFDIQETKDRPFEYIGMEFMAMRKAKGIVAGVLEKIEKELEPTKEATAKPLRK